MNNDSAYFRSILFDGPVVAKDVDGQPPPEFFSDLNLDQIVDAITAGRDEYNLKPFFFFPLAKLHSVVYRYEILREFENRALLEMVRSFAAEMRSARNYLSRAEKLDCKFEKERWFLDAPSTYCAAIRRLTSELGARIYRRVVILDRATPNSIVITSESLLSTTLSDALFLSEQVLRKIIEPGVALRVGDVPR